MPKFDGTEIDKAAGAALKRIRLDRGFSLQQLGESIGLTYQQVQKYETGANRMSVSTLHALCMALDVNPMRIIPWGDNAPAEAPRGRNAELDKLVSTIESLDLSAPSMVAARSGIVKTLQALR